jgi:hypothetical protein
MYVTPQREGITVGIWTERNTMAIYFESLLDVFIRWAKNKGECKIEVSTAVAMKNAVFWDIKTQVVPYRRHISSPLERPAG